MRGRFFFLVLGVVLLGCGGGGSGGSSPTEPTGTAQVAGTWNGSWSVAGVGLTTQMVLTQNGSAISGTFSLLGESFPIQGTVDNSLKISWHAVGASCGSLTGDGTASSPNPTQIVGTIDLNTVGCTNGQHVNGPVTWTKGSAAAASPAGKRLTLEELAQAIARRGSQGRE